MFVCPDTAVVPSDCSIVNAHISTCFDYSYGNIIFFQLFSIAPGRLARCLAHAFPLGAKLGTQHQKTKMCRSTLSPKMRLVYSSGPNQFLAPIRSQVLLPSSVLCTLFRLISWTRARVVIHHILEQFLDRPIYLASLIEHLARMIFSLVYTILQLFHLKTFGEL
jgi:hypothetical protein